MCTRICLNISAFLFIVFEQNGHPHTQSAILIGFFCKKNEENIFNQNFFIYNDKFLDRHIDIWRTQLLFWVNVSIQYGHENGFSPVCVRICLRIISPDRIIFGQNGQAYCCPASLMGSACNKWIRNIWWNFQIIGTFFIVSFRIHSSIKIGNTYQVLDIAICQSGKNTSFTHWVPRRLA